MKKKDVNKRKSGHIFYYGARKKRDFSFWLLSRIIVVITIIAIIIPILYIFSVSLRTKDTVYEDYFAVIPKKVTLFNYLDALNYAKKHLGVTFLEMFRNSLICTSVAVGVAIIIAAFSSFSFSNYRFKGKELTFTIIIASFAIPAQVLLIPLFFILRNLKILNTYFAIILPYIGFLIPIATLILRSFFEQIPHEIKESAKIDGASDLRIFLQIILPLAKSAIATCVILLFLETWNEFIYALVFLQNPKIQTIPVAIAKIAGSRYMIPMGTYAASIMITVIPILIVFVMFQKWFIAGITMGSIKG